MVTHFVARNPKITKSPRTIPVTHIISFYYYPLLFHEPKPKHGIRSDRLKNPTSLSLPPSLVPLPRITCEWVSLYPQQEPEPISFLSSPSPTYLPKPTNSSLTPPKTTISSSPSKKKKKISLFFLQWVLGFQQHLQLITPNQASETSPKAASHRFSSISPPPRSANWPASIGRFAGRRLLILCGNPSCLRIMGTL